MDGGVIQADLPTKSWQDGTCAALPADLCWVSAKKWPARRQAKRSTQAAETRFQ